MSEESPVLDDELNVPADKSTEPKDLKALFIEIALYLVIGILILIFVPKYVLGRVSVDGTSMCNTLDDRDQLVCEKLSVNFNRLRRFDIIYFYPNGNTDSEPYIKRVIGLPGDTVYIDNSVIYVNDQPLVEDFGAEEMRDSGIASTPIVLGAEEFFVLGDNRNHSTDSRSKHLGIIPREDIIGRAIFRIWPLNKFGPI